jgi:hypothetical protein
MKKIMTLLVISALALGMISVAQALPTPSYTFESVGSSFYSEDYVADYGYAECYFAANSPSGNLTHDLNAFKDFIVTIQAPEGQKFLAKAVPGAESREITFYVVGATPGWDYRGRSLPPPDYWESYYTWTPAIDITDVSFEGWEGSGLPSVISGDAIYYTDDGGIAGDAGLPGQGILDGSLSIDLGLGEVSFSSISFTVHAPASATALVNLDSNYGIDWLDDDGAIEYAAWSQQMYAFASAYGDGIVDADQWFGVTGGGSPVPEPGTILAALSILGPAGLMFRRRKA